MELDRNAPCKCGSGKKYKKCCYGKDADKKISATVLSAGDAEKGVSDAALKIREAINMDRTHHHSENCCASHSMKSRVQRMGSRGS